MQGASLLREALFAYKLRNGKDLHPLGVSEKRFQRAPSGLSSNIEFGLIRCHCYLDQNSELDLLSIIFCL